MAPQLVKNFQVFYESQGLFTIFTTADHLYLSCNRLIQSINSHPVSLTFVVKLPSDPYLSSPIRATYPFPSYPYLFDNTNNIVETYKLLTSLQNYPSLLLLLPAAVPPSFSASCSRTPQSVTLPLCQRPSFASFQNNGLTYTMVCFNFCIFRYHVGKQEVLE
jgi:hypothetical protein